MRRVTRLVDDLDGGPAAETVQFGLDGAAYELDLSPENAATLRSVLGRYVAAARRVTVSVPARPDRRPPLAAVATEPAPDAAAEPVPPSVEPFWLVPAEPVASERVELRPVIGLDFSDRHSNGSANG
jgi:hypothetical protein